MAAGQCNEEYLVEMRYKTSKSIRWKMYKRNMWLSDSVIMQVAKAPMLRVLKILILPPATMVDYFKLIKLPLQEEQNGYREGEEKVTEKTI